MISFLIDNQLPPALAQWIEARGFKAQHVLALSHGQSPDGVIWELASRIPAVIVSKDEDFAKLTLVRDEPVSVVWVRFGNCRTPELISKWEKVWPEVVRQLESGAKLIEVF